MYIIDNTPGERIKNHFYVLYPLRSNPYILSESRKNGTSLKWKSITWPWWREKSVHSAKIATPQRITCLDVFSMAHLKITRHSHVNRATWTCAPRRCVTSPGPDVAYTSLHQSTSLYLTHSYEQTASVDQSVLLSLFLSFLFPFLLSLKPATPWISVLFYTSTFFLASFNPTSVASKPEYTTETNLEGSTNWWPRTSRWPYVARKSLRTNNRINIPRKPSWIDWFFW